MSEVFGPPQVNFLIISPGSALISDRDADASLIGNHPQRGPK